MEDSKFFEKITLVIHTKNRPCFLLRAIDYYNKLFHSTKIHVIILDGSSKNNFAIISEELAKKKLSLNLQVLHSGESARLTHRIAEALPMISTPYVLLGADDDFYSLDWLEPAVSLLDRDPEYGVAYGHAINFKLEKYKAFGALVDFGFLPRNPPVRWLEGNTPIERLSEIGKSDWATTGWYALQRTKLFAIIVNTALENNLHGYHFERLLVFCHAALTKTRMLDYVYLARQVADVQRPALSFKAEKDVYETLISTSALILSTHKDISKECSNNLVRRAYQAEIYQLKRNDSRKILRAIANCFPVLRKIRSFFVYSILGRRERPEFFFRDPKLPKIPKIELDNQFRKTIIRATTNSEC